MSRILVVADVHANLAALLAVIDDASRDRAIDTVWCLGDIVGYGAQPRECIQLLQTYSYQAIAGNHDLAAATGEGVEAFNPFAAEAARWTALELSEDDRAWLLALPRSQIEGEFTLAHGTLRDPVWEYLMDSEQAAVHLSLQSTPYGLVGHTHVPIVFLEDEPSEAREDPPVAGVQELGQRRFVANVGSVGQPRDGDPRAAYGLVDTEERRLEFRRVEYDIAGTQAKILAAGLPLYLAERLAYGR